jgi:hypothetical protein
MLTKDQISSYKKLDNPPQSLYMALIKQVHVNPSHKGRTFSVPEGGYSALVVYYYFLKMLDYTDDQAMDETNMTDTKITIVQKHLDHLLRGGPEYDRVNIKLQLVENYMVHEQLKEPYEEIID